MASPSTTKSDQAMIDAADRVAQLEQQLADLQSSGSGDTHAQTLACGCEVRTAAPVATLHGCDQHGTQPVRAVYELPPSD